MMIEGNILLCRQEGNLEAWCIRQVLRSRYNHSAILIEIAGEPFIFEARGGARIKPIPLGEWLRQHPYTEIKTVRAMVNLDRVMTSKDVRYDFWGCVNRIPYRITGHWYGAREGRGTEKFYCIEHTAWCCEMSNWWEISMDAIENYNFPVLS